MKKVRFLSTSMDDSDCHSPRPFIRKELVSGDAEKQPKYPVRSSFDLDPVTLFETSNSIPYPIVNKSEVCKENWGGKDSVNIQPSDQLNLSFLDSSYIEPRKPTISKTTAFQPFIRSDFLQNSNGGSQTVLPRSALKAIENRELDNPPNTLIQDNSFFIRPGDIDKPLQQVTGNLNKDFKRLNIHKQNDVFSKKIEILHNYSSQLPVNNLRLDHGNQVVAKENCCKCHHCRPAVQQHLKTNSAQHYCNATIMQNEIPQLNLPSCRQIGCNLNCLGNIPAPVISACHCNNLANQPQNAVDNKTRAIEKYEQSKQIECMEIEKPSAVVKEKREPTVSDLFKIIKLQNEQLQLLQEKVDRFITTNAQTNPILPVQNYVSEKVTVKTVENDHKISIGVMTSFEVRTSTIFNKEVVKTQNVQVNKRPSTKQDNHPALLNFLDGIPPVESPQTKELNVSNSLYESDSSNDKSPNRGEKTLNEYSLYDVQVDQATTPMLSPEQTLYLDVRDYSDSDSTSGESNVGWTYYNKVMTHVNGMLQESDMPSSASALCRAARRLAGPEPPREQTSFSVMKRVKFGDDLRHPNFPAPTQAVTDTSMKMNQLAAKYLSRAPARRAPPTTDMSFATRKYMERHQLLQGVPAPAHTAQSPVELPRFLDITALKQQPKFL